MTTKPTLPLHCLAIAVACTLTAPSNATELVYYPFNPSFGGNPLNGTVLLNSALATNKHTDPALDNADLGIEEQSPLELFNQTLERSIISRLASAASSKIVNADGQFVPGSLETDSFLINIVDLGNGYLSITTTDKLTGGETTFQVGK
ncbi:curli assembly protein CsgF [Pollutimonas harenae]|uniref:Curli production assembly/transport component CsgF n=1 Tax=Pollutimonas harenae TaxID=657015 RepID=A0A853H749_9BURK|nr:curli assembly protein CsgF [Pollutimonas harenae]NYT85924.1 curli assembly protein CsgF [Pollutimonas harenae]TEA70976.1 curli assembly protein CsgF [Pollutimonas harenae]